MEKVVVSDQEFEKSLARFLLGGLLPVPAEIEGGDSLIMVFVELTVFKSGNGFVFEAG
jgi:hypothetical protein